MENQQHWTKTPRKFHSHFFDFLKIIFNHITISLVYYWRSKCHSWVIPHNSEFLMVSVGAALLSSNVLPCQHKIYLDVSLVKWEKWSQKNYMCYLPNYFQSDHHYCQTIKPMSPTFVIPLWVSIGWRTYFWSTSGNAGRLQAIQDL